MIDELRACRHFYTGDEVRRYRDGRITRNGTDLSRAEIDAAVTNFQPVYDAWVAARAAAEAAKVQRETDAAAIKQDNAVKQLINASPDQIETWITNNVTNLAEAKAVLIRLTKALSAVAREAFVDD